MVTGTMGRPRELSEPVERRALLDRETATALDREARRRGATRAECIRRAIRQWLTNAGALDA